MDGTTNIIELKGIGEKSATAFGRLGIRDVDSLITMYPKYYLTYEDPKDVNEIEIGQRVSIFVRINSEVHIQYAKRMKIVTCTAKDHTGTIMLVWYNMPYLKKQLHQGRDYIFTGTPIYKNVPYDIPPIIYSLQARSVFLICCSSNSKNQIRFPPVVLPHQLPVS